MNVAALVFALMLIAAGLWVWASCDAPIGG